MNICVFLSAYDKSNIYTKHVQELGALIARGGHTLVYGSSDKGLMKVVADSVQENGGKLFGITMELTKDSSRKNIDQLITAATLGQRKDLFVEHSDAFIILPGGIGSIDEITHILELKKHKTHDKPVVFLNINGFYDGMRTQLKHMENQRFLPCALDDLCVFVDSPTQTMAHIDGKT